MNCRIKRNGRSMQSLQSREITKDVRVCIPSLFNNDLIKQSENGLRRFNNIAQKRHSEQGRLWSFLPSTSLDPSPLEHPDEDFNKEQETIEMIRSEIKTRYQERRINFSSRIKQQYSPQKAHRISQLTLNDQLSNIRILGMNVKDHLRQMSLVQKTPNRCTSRSTLKQPAKAKPI